MFLKWQTFTPSLTQVGRSILIPNRYLLHKWCQIMVSSQTPRIIVKSLLASRWLFGWWTTYHSRNLMVQERELPWQNCATHSLLQIIPLLVAISLQMLFCFYRVCEPPPSCCPQTGSCSFCPWSTEGSLWLACSSSSPPSKWRGYMADPCFLCYLFVWRNRSGPWVGLQRHSIKQRHFIFTTV